MRKDLLISIVLAIVGTIVAYFVTNLVTPAIEKVSVKTVDSSISTDIPDPNPELFNYRAINPTVEVYVGDNGNCQSYGSDGRCLDCTSQETPTENDNQGGE